MMGKVFETPVLEVCTCGASRPHVYFYASSQPNMSGKLPIPFYSVGAVDAFLSSQVVIGFMSADKKEELVKFAREAKLQEKMEEDEFPILIMSEIIASSAQVKE